MSIRRESEGERLERATDLLRRLVNWGTAMGGWEASVWYEAHAFVEAETAAKRIAKLRAMPVGPNETAGERLDALKRAVCAEPPLRPDERGD